MSDHFDSQHDSPAVRRAQLAYLTALADELLPPMRLAARGCGYAIAAHGTQARDLDLIAIPWTEQANETLMLDRILGVIAGVTGRACRMEGWTLKPHGRKSVIIVHGGHTGEIDLSVMPCAPESGEKT